jgi:hypothetical protein
MDCLPAMLTRLEISEAPQPPLAREIGFAGLIPPWAALAAL